MQARGTKMLALLVLVQPSCTAFSTARSPRVHTAASAATISRSTPWRSASLAPRRHARTYSPPRMLDPWAVDPNEETINYIIGTLVTLTGFATGVQIMRFGEDVGMLWLSCSCLDAFLSALLTLTRQPGRVLASIGSACLNSHVGKAIARGCLYSYLYSHAIHARTDVSTDARGVHRLGE